MEYLKNPDGTFGKLPKRNVDFGGGLERIMMAFHNVPDSVAINHRPILNYLEKVSGKTYGQNEKEIKAFRVIADHMKASVFLIGDGVVPSKNDQGYYVRRLIRRSVRYADALGVTPNSLSALAKVIADMYKDTYPELEEKHDHIQKTLAEEEAQFRTTLERGMREFERFAKNGQMSSQDTFQLVTTYGFPLELIMEEAGERGIKQIDTEGFKELLKQHQDLSRSGSEQKFKGGLADTAEQTVRLHTAHHLLLKALQIVLGPEVHQRGSNITQERLRIDFNYPQKMTDEQKKEVERIVNEKINEDIPMLRIEMDKEEAEKLGAEHEFGAKYPDRVSIYELAPKGATEEAPDFEHAFSIEFCGGPHVTHTGELSKSGVFKIQKEEAVAQGIRRIKAVLQ